MLSDSADVLWGKGCFGLFLGKPVCLSKLAASVHCDASVRWARCAVDRLAQRVICRTRSIDIRLRVFGGEHLIVDDVVCCNILFELSPCCCIASIANHQQARPGYTLNA